MTDLPSNINTIPEGFDLDLDRHSVEAMQMAALGMDLVLTGNAGTGKSWLAQRMQRILNKDNIQIFDEDGLENKIKTKSQNKKQKITTVDFSQPSTPDHEILKSENPTIDFSIKTLHQLMRSRQDSKVDDESGLPTLAGFNRDPARMSEKLRVGYANGDVYSTAIALAILLFRNELVSPGIQQTIVLTRPETLNLVELLLTRLCYPSTMQAPKFIHPHDTQGLSQDIMLFATAEMDALGSDADVRWIEMFVNRIGWRLDILLPFNKDEEYQENKEFSNRMMLYLMYQSCPVEMNFEFTKTDFFSKSHSDISSIRFFDPKDETLNQQLEIDYGDWDFNKNGFENATPGPRITPDHSINEIKLISALSTCQIMDARHLRLARAKLRGLEYQNQQNEKLNKKSIRKDEIPAKTYRHKVENQQKIKNRDS